MKLEYAEKRLLFKVIAGSKAYGLDLPTSDTDIRGIYLQPNEFRLGNGYIQQVENKTNDTVYYELNRFINLLSKNNPNIIENLFVPEDKILVKNSKILPLYNQRHKFLTKQIRLTFGGYSISQIKKARGLNKKIVNPVDKKKRTPVDYCFHIDREGKQLKLIDWLKEWNFKQEHCGLAKFPNGTHLYKLYYDQLTDIKENEKIYNPRFNNLKPLGYKGIISSDIANDVNLSSIPKKAYMWGIVYFDLNGYQSYCKQYKEYWEWVKNRNPVRYNDNISHNQNYDGKNLMHCLRMLDMAIEVAEGKGVNLIRPNREWLLSIRKGAVKYDDIIGLIEEKKNKMDEAFEKADLPDKVDPDFVHELILRIRNE
jgi:hypothetical protein